MDIDMITAARAVDGVRIVGTASSADETGDIVFGQTALMNLTRAQVSALIDVLEEIEEALEP